jgi:hypothetical protein
MTYPIWTDHYYEGAPGVDADHVPPVTRESFITAYVDAKPHWRCQDAAFEWVVLHVREVLADEIDEDPS